MDSGRKELISENDHSIIAEYITLTTLLEVLMKDIEVIKASPLKLKIGYVNALESALDRAGKELTEVRSQMRKHGIKVFDRQRVNQEFTSWEYLCRGYEGETRRWAAALRNQTTEKLLSYLEKK